MSEKGVCRTFLLFHCLLETDVVIFILADLSIWSYSLGHISCGFYRPVRSEEEEKQTLLSFFFLFCLIWSVCETANGFNYGEGEGEGGEPFGKKGERKAKYPPAPSHEAASKTVLRCRYGDFRLLDSDNDPPILNLKGHLNPTQFDGAREPISCLRVAGSLHHSFRDLRHALFSPEAICSIGSSILHEECRYFQSKLALRQNISLYGTCISEHNHFFWAKVPSQKDILCVRGLPI